MHVPFVLENIEQAADEYFCQLVAFTAVGFPTDAYGVFLSVYFQDGVADVCFDGMGADRTGHLAVHIGTVEVQCEIFCYLEQFPAGFLFSLITPQTLIELFLSFSVVMRLSFQVLSLKISITSSSLLQALKPSNMVSIIRA